MCSLRGVGPYSYSSGKTPVLTSNSMKLCLISASVGRLIQHQNLWIKVTATEVLLELDDQGFVYPMKHELNHTLSLKLENKRIYDVSRSVVLRQYACPQIAKANDDPTKVGNSYSFFFFSITCGIQQLQISFQMQRQFAYHNLIFFLFNSAIKWTCHHLSGI